MCYRESDPNNAIRLGFSAVWFGDSSDARWRFFRDGGDEIYQDAAAGVYRFLDLLLGRLVFLAGPEAIVIPVSDRMAAEPEPTNFGRELSDIPFGAPARSNDQEFGELHRRARSVGQLALNGPLILLQDFRSAAPFQLASFEIQNEFDFPRLEGIASYRTAHDFGDQSLEAIEH